MLEIGSPGILEPGSFESATSWISLVVSLKPRRLKRWNVGHSEFISWMLSGGAACLAFPGLCFMILGSSYSSW